MAVSDLEKKIIKQLEYYFGDVNLNFDKFLKEKITSNSEGWVDLDVLLTFNRLKTLSEDAKVIIEALKKSDSELLDVSKVEEDIEGEESKTKWRIRRVKPIPAMTKDYRESLKARTIYIKGFPSDELEDVKEDGNDEKECLFESKVIKTIRITLDDIITFLDSLPVCENQVESVQLRRFKKPHAFKGSIFVTFKTSEVAKAFLALEKVVYSAPEVDQETEKNEEKKKEEFELIRLTREQYWAQKELERKEKKSATSSKTAEKVAENIEKDKAVLEEKMTQMIVKDTILHLDGLPPSCTREQIRDVFEEFAKIIWVDFESGDTEAWLRFDKAGDAEKAWDQACAKHITADSLVEEAKKNPEANGSLVMVPPVRHVLILATEVRGDVLKGEAEKTHWQNVFKEKTQSRTKKRTAQRGGGGGGYRGKKRRKY